ncbi:MAG TPA: GNAT family N-acetyltransferase, partial [Candidatus Paceibacterota bacterium]|nr:GNAT family N-acetyltransferase [Candidatus Paceibacterota bacterium]
SVADSDIVGRVASRGAMAGLETNAGSGDPAYSAADSDVVGRVASRGAMAGLETNAGSGDPAYSAADSDVVGRVASRGAMADIGTGAGSGDPAYSVADSDIVGRVASRGAMADIGTDHGPGPLSSSAALGPSRLPLCSSPAATLPPRSPNSELRRTDAPAHRRTDAPAHRRTDAPAHRRTDAPISHLPSPNLDLRSPNFDHPSPSSPIPLNPLTALDWDDMVLSHPGSTFFHTAAWARVLHDTYGFNPVYMAVFADGRLTGLLPCMDVDGLIGGRRGIGLPFTDDSAPLVEDATQFLDLAHGLIALGRIRGWRTWECRGGAQWMPDARLSLSFYAHTLDLTAGEAGLSSGFAPSVRRAIRKADRSGLDVRIEDSAASVDAFYRLHCMTRRRQGMPIQPKAFFDNIARHVIARGAGRVILAHRLGQPVAGAMFFESGRRAFYKFGASDLARQDLRANNLVMWRAIRFYAGCGFAALDFGRTSMANEGLRRFKAGWGAVESRLSYFKYDLRRSRYMADRDRSSGWHNAVFRCLPIVALRALGSLMYRHLT